MEDIVLTNRHHPDSWRLQEIFGCEVHCIANGLHELEGRGPVTPFQFGAVRWPGIDGLSFVPDWLMDDPPATKQRLREAYRGLLDLDFARLLLAHGDPVVNGARAELHSFLDGAG